MIFDKTGTLTKGHPAVAQLHTISGDDAHMLKLAASVQAASEHPLARAVQEKAIDLQLSLAPVTEFASHTGTGVEGVVEGHHIFIGKSQADGTRGRLAPS